MNTSTLERTASDQLDFRELDEEDIEMLPSRETLCCWHYNPCYPVYYCHPCHPVYCYGPSW